MKREIATFGVLGALLLVVVVAVPPFRTAVVETLRTAWDRQFPAEWSGYYVVYDDPATDPSEGGSGQLYFASGSFPGRAVRVLSDPPRPGGWSGTREQYIVGSGSRLYVGDRYGSVALLGDTRELRPIGGLSWVADREIVFGAMSGGPNRWVIRVDARSAMLVDQRGLPEGFVPFAVSPDGTWILAVDTLGTSAGPPPVVLYDPVATRTARPDSGEMFQGWLGDGRMLVVRGEWPGPSQLIARAIGGADATIFRSEHFVRFAVANGHRVAVTVLDADGDRQSIWLIEPGMDPRRVAEVPYQVVAAAPSGDGGFVAFDRYGDGGVRAGVIDVATGRITYACQSGCAGLALR